MLKFTKDYHAYSEHPFLKKIRDYFTENNHKEYDFLLHKHIAFVYPKILVFSFKGFPETYKSINSPLDRNLAEEPEWLIDKASDDLDNDENANPEIEKGNIYKNFFEILVKCISILGIHPIILFDVRSHRIMDEPLFNSVFGTTKPISKELLVLVSKDWQKELFNNLHVQADYCFYSTNELISHLKQIETDNNNISLLTLPSKVTLQSLEEFFLKENIEEKIIKHLSLNINFNKVSNISVFAIDTLIAFMYSASHKYGNI